MEEFVVELSAEEEFIRQIIEPLLDSEGFELIRLKLVKALSKSKLAIFADTKSKKNGITMDNLTDISRLLSDVLDAAFNDSNILSGQYDLEVSSPGLDRPLTKRSHFLDAVSQKIKTRIKKTETFGLKSVSGMVLEALDDGVVIEPEHKKEEKIKVLYSDMADAHIIFDFSTLDKHKKKSAEK